MLLITYIYFATLLVLHLPPSFGYFGSVIIPHTVLLVFCWQGLKTNIAAKNIAEILCCYPDSIYPPRQLTQCLNNFFLPFFKSGQLLVSYVYSILLNLIIDDVSLHLFFNRHLWWLKNWITQLPSCPWLQVFWNDGTFQIISENQSMCFTYC